MLRTTRIFAATLLAATMLTAPLARAASDQEQLVQRSLITVQDLQKDREFGNARDLMHRARAIMIVPRMFKGGFFVGGEGGAGLLLSRTATGWSSPAFYDIGSASFGLQIGLEQSEMVLFIMSQKALDAVMRNQFKIGAGAGIAVVSLGSNVGGSTTSNAGADIVSWASSSGAYAGISLDGSIIKPNLSDDRAYYGHSVTTRQILARHMPATALQTTLDGV